MDQHGPWCSERALRSAGSRRASCLGYLPKPAELVFKRPLIDASLQASHVHCSGSRRQGGRVEFHRRGRQEQARRGER